jgi:hypothetical protein
LPKRWPTRLSSAAAALALLAACSSKSGTNHQPVVEHDGPATTATVPGAIAGPTTLVPPDPTIVAAGDIACPEGLETSPVQCQMETTAQKVESLHPTAVITLGDEQYELGKPGDFAAVYDKTWGRFKDKTYPVPGNHEYAGGKAPGYFGEFGDRAHPPDGWYSVDVGTWHLVLLNSVCSAIGGCGEGSREYQWLQQDLESTKAACILAAWHHPRWSSGLHGSDPGYEPFWQLLAAHGADIVLSGHDHHYERFAPKQGITQFVVGTGGRSLYPIPGKEDGSLTRNDTDFGVLELTLHDGSYDWHFSPAGQGIFSDAGSAPCQ